MTDQAQAYATHQDLNRVEKRVEALGEQLTDSLREIHSAINKLSQHTAHTTARYEGDVYKAINERLNERDSQQQRSRFAIVSLSITVLMVMFSGLWWSVESQTEIANLRLENKLLKVTHAIEVVNQEQTDQIDRLLAGKN